MGLGQGRTTFILDNLITEGKVKSMIVAEEFDEQFGSSASAWARESERIGQGIDEATKAVGVQHAYYESPGTGHES